MLFSYLSDLGLRYDVDLFKDSKVKKAMLRHISHNWPERKSTTVYKKVKFRLMDLSNPEAKANGWPVSSPAASANKKSCGLAGFSLTEPNLTSK